MACWSRVFQSNGGCASTTSGCSTSCYNSTTPNQNGTKPTIFDELPVMVSSTADAVGYWVDQLRRRLAAQEQITSTTMANYTIVLRRGTRIDTLEWMIGSTGQMPLQVTYTTPVDSGTASFHNMSHAIDWHVQLLV